MVDVTPQNDFEQAIIDFFHDVALMVIGKNRAYGDSYRNLRMQALTELGNAKIPLWIHQNEKLKRYMENSPTADREDPLKDGAGYFGLEAICARFDDVQTE